MLALNSVFPRLFHSLSCSSTMEDNNLHQESTFLHSLNNALDDLRSMPLHYLRIDINSPSINSILDLENRAHSVLSPLDSILSHLSHLKTLINNLRSCQAYTPLSFLKRSLISYEFSGVTMLIKKEIQVRFDRENVRNLAEILQGFYNEEEKLRALDHFEDRVSKGFDRDLQDLILRVRLFSVLESIIGDNSCPISVREKVGSVISALAYFNKVVFVGNVMMGVTLPMLVSMGTSKSLEVITSLVSLIKGHLVDEMEQNGQIPKIIGFLSSEEVEVRAMALDCLLQMVYYGRKEVVKVLIECGLVEKLMLLQRNETEIEEELDELGAVEEAEIKSSCCVCKLERKKGDCSTFDCPFLGCVARFAVQVEVGEVMEKAEKKEIKMEILRRARAAAVSEAEAATVVAEVLWGSYP